MSGTLNMSRARAKHLANLLAPPDSTDFSRPPEPQFAPATCPDCGQDVMRLLDAAEIEAAARFREVVRLRADGMSREQIGAAIGASTSLVSRVLNGRAGRRAGAGGTDAPVLVEAEEHIAYGVRGPGAGQMRVVRLAHRPRCPARGEAA